MGPVYDQPRDTADRRPRSTPASATRSWRCVDRIRWIPSFGYERELDWLLNMRDWMISKKRYYGLALPIYDCRGVRDVRRHRRSRGARASARSRAGTRSRATRRTGRTWTRSRSPARRAASRSSRIPDVGNPWLDAGHRAVLDAPLPRGPRVLGEVVPGRLRHRELPRPVPQLVLRDARDVDGAPARGAVQDDLRLRDAVRRGRAPDAQELGQRDRVRRGRRAHGRRRDALDVRVGAGRTTTSCSAGTRPTRRGASCSCCGTCTRSS